MHDQPETGTFAANHQAVKPTRKDTYPYQPVGKVAASVYGCIAPPTEGATTIQVDTKKLAQSVKDIKQKRQK